MTFPEIEKCGSYSIEQSLIVLCYVITYKRSILKSIGWPPGWVGFVTNLGLLEGGFCWVLVSHIKIKIILRGNGQLFLWLLSQNCLLQSVEFCHKFPKMTSLNQNLPSQGCVNLQGFAVNSIISMTCRLFCLPYVVVCSLCCKGQG